ncbi:hypothetical protein RSAG8_03859, partial [Rhizoctonia solani AG-8 WAC10335]
MFSRNVLSWLRPGGGFGSRFFSVANSPAPVAADLPSALSLIQSQPSHYAVATVAGRKYLLAPRDVLTVPRLPRCLLYIESLHVS